MIEQEWIDAVDEKLGSVCAAGYALGLVGEANIRYVLSQFPELVTRQRVYRLGDILVLTHGVPDAYDEVLEARLDELKEFLHGADDYIILDEATFDEVQMEEQDAEVERIATENGVSEQFVWQAIEDLEGYFEWEQDYVFLSNVSEDDVIARAREIGNTWEAHYGTSEESVQHYVESCWYCERAKEVA